MYKKSVIINDYVIECNIHSKLNLVRSYQLMYFARVNWTK